MRIYKKASRIQRAKAQQEAFAKLSPAEKAAQKAANKEAYDMGRVYPAMFQR